MCTRAYTTPPAPAVRADFGLGSAPWGPAKGWETKDVNGDDEGKQMELSMLLLLVYATHLPRLKRGR